MSKAAMAIVVSVCLIVSTLACVKNPTSPSDDKPKGPVDFKFDVVSRGGDLAFFGEVEFYKNESRFYYAQGGGGGARGINIAAIDMRTANLIGTVKNFDGFFNNANEQDNLRMSDFIKSLPDGTLILIAAGDTLSLNALGKETLESLGSKLIRQYRFRDSWAMISVKGESGARSEKLSHQTVLLSITITVP